MRAGVTVRFPLFVPSYLWTLQACEYGKLSHPELLTTPRAHSPVISLATGNHFGTWHEKTAALDSWFEVTAYSDSVTVPLHVDHRTAIIGDCVF
ncbi:hypothetical protein SCLCIDRAFT_1214968 [Scleroderma citrinum Foug A]|uniref:Uncharacterized protein n=1 Tax=Scleroderma citrinum Foug A TaxID=1036808 RepID=A0A0C3DP53_9AGAM|nr:hypothetical protein SCLCIDRAFT_1214968 [Scleroderma citrinum Foug A]